MAAGRGSCQSVGAMILAWGRHGFSDGATTVRALEEHVATTTRAVASLRPPGRLRGAHRLFYYVSPRSVAWRRRRGAVWSSAAREGGCGAVVGEERERSPQLLSVQYRVGRCGTPPRELFATLKEQGLTPARTAPVAWRGQAWWSSRPVGRVAESTRPYSMRSAARARRSTGRTRLAWLSPGRARSLARSPTTPPARTPVLPTDGAAPGGAARRRPRRR